MNILILLEEQKERELLEDIIKKEGHCVYTAVDANKAIEIWQEKKIPIVIAEWHPHKKECKTLCRMIRDSGNVKSTWNTYIIVLIPKLYINDTIEALEAGADDYFTKPIIEQELFVRLKTGQQILRLSAELEELLDKKQEIETLNANLEKLALTDTLTSLGNRRYFYEVATKFHQLAMRHGRRYGLIICDIDYFKSYNDTYGHLSGDNVLQEISNKIKTLLRKSDEIFRYGGEEFVILLPEQDIEGSLKAAEKIRRAIYKQEKEHSKSRYGRITISCGVSGYEPGVETWEEVLALADKALYEAKEAGRNCTKQRYPFSS